MLDPSASFSQIWHCMEWDECSAWNHLNTVS